MKSACTGACLSKWPVVAPLAKNDIKGVTTKGFVTFNRPDGLKQQSIDCWPIYTFSGDTKPGDTNGQGVGGTWYAVSPDAKLVGRPEVTSQQPFRTGPSLNVTLSDGPVAHATGV